MEQIIVAANGLRFACLAAGDAADPLLILLHGFPDNGWTWEHQFTPLAAAGYRVVAPNLRGYPPTEIPADGYNDGATLAPTRRSSSALSTGGMSSSPAWRMRRFPRPITP